MKHRVQKLSFLAWLLVAGPAVAQSSAPADARATILTPISITYAEDMNFGNVVAGSTAGKVVLTAAGERTVTGGATFMSTQVGTVEAASFTVSGVSNATYTVTLPTTPLTLNGPSTATMTVDTFTSNSATPGILTGGSQTLSVGGTLNVASPQAAGAYLGTFAVSVAYN